MRRTTATAPRSRAPAPPEAGAIGRVPRTPRIAAGAGIAAVLAVLFSWPGDPRRTGPAATVEPEAFRLPEALEGALVEVHRAWRADERAERVVEAVPLAAAHPEDFAALLALGEHVLFGAALEVAQARPDERWLLPLLGALDVAAPAVRAAIVRAIDAIEPWSADALAGLLEGGEPTPVLLAAIEIVDGRGGELADRAIALLEHEAAEVRSAASRMLQRHLPAERLDAIVELARSAEPAVLLTAIDALARADMTAGVEEFLSRALSDPDESVRLAALAALRARSGPLGDPTAVLSVAQGGSPREQASALYTLEATGTAMPDELRATCFQLGPLARSFAARQLVREGDVRGMAMLLDLLDSAPDEWAGLEPHEVEAARFPIRELFARCTGSEMYGAEEAWRSWLLERENAEPSEMLAPALPLR